ncbi:MAG: hypothetical protein U9Q04_07890 [Campylobacterota bacterium]|nr:hypothetical protein [Campylobacterota bacterium]
MFIGWIRKSSLQADIKSLSKEILIDENLLVNSVNEDQSLCFGAYGDNELEALISAYRFENYIFINNFYYKEGFEDQYKKRLVKILLNNIYDDEKSIIFMASKSEQKIFEEFDFNIYANFKKAVYDSGGAAFNFTNTMAKSINSENYIGVVNKLDKSKFGDERVEYILQTLTKSSSLFLSTQFGYQHSYALGKSVIKISPWIMSSEAFSDAEKLLRGVIYHRGLKKLISFIPKDIDEIVDLYSSYNFELKDDYKLMYKNKKPNIELEAIYGF